MPKNKQVNGEEPSSYQYRAQTGVHQQPANVPALAFNGAPIHEKGEMISLTDMWKAAGSPDAQRPADWRDYAGRVFIEAVALANNAVADGIFTTTRGRNGQTFGHWQVALGYAQYLSPEFHMWCNTVVREKMEGRPKPVADAELMEMWRRDDGILRMLAHKVTDIQKLVALASSFDETVARIVDQKLSEDPRRAVIQNVSVRQILDEEHKVPSKGRRSLQRKIFVRLAAYCLENKIAAYRCAHSGTWLFERNAASAFIRNKCSGLIADHVAKLNGQGVLRLVVAKAGDTK